MPMRKLRYLIIKKQTLVAIGLILSALLLTYLEHTLNYKNDDPRGLKIMVEQKPQVAIIIDDLGNPYNKGVEEIMALNKYPLTLGVMPNMEMTTDHALRAEKNGFEVLIHMPMEPEAGQSNWLGPGAIKKNMSTQEITLNIEKALEQIPNAVGLNNHMGSLITQKREIMQPVLEFLKEKDLFFVDSLTSKKTICRSMAREIGVPFIERTLFLDNNYDYVSIRKEILKLAQLAKTNGYAIGIGHVGPQGLNTAKALHDTLPLLESEGVELVFVSDLIKNRAIPEDL